MSWLLKYLRRRARLTQRDLAIAVGYSPEHVCRLEQNQRTPDLTTVAALFVPALDLEDEPELVAQLLELTAVARNESLGGRSLSVRHTVTRERSEAVGFLEAIPSPPHHHVERTALLAAAHAALGDAPCLTLCGLPGAGKTTLGGAFARGWRHGPVLWHTLTAGVTTSLDRLVQQVGLFLLAHGQDAVAPVLAPSDGQPQLAPEQQTALLVAALAALASGGNAPLLSFDNVHLVRGDAAVVGLLRHLAAATPATLLLTSREHAPLPEYPELAVGGLSRTEGGILLTKLGASLDDSVADRLLTKTGGSPMLVRLAVGQLKGGVLDAAALIDHLETTPQVEAYLLDTVVRGLPEGAARLATQLAVFRQPVNLYDDALIARVQGADGPYDHAQALRDLQRSHVLAHPAHATLHPLLHEYLAVTVAADPARRRRLHRVAAEWSEQALGDVIEAAYHYGHAGDIAQAVEVLEERMEWLVGHGQAFTAVAVAGELLARLRRGPKPNRNVLRRLLAARADLLVNTSRAAEAEADYRAAFALSEQPPLDAAIGYRFARCLWQRGHPDEALQVCQESAARLSPSDAILQAQLAATESWTHYVLSQYDDCMRLAERALALADTFATRAPVLADQVRGRVYNTRAGILREWGRVDEAIDQYERAIAAARRSSLRQAEYRYLGNLGITYYVQGCLRESMEALERVGEGLEEIGDSFAQAAVQRMLATIRYLRGDITGALDQLNGVMALLEQVGDTATLSLCHNDRSHMLLSLSRVGEARAIITGLLARVPAGSARSYILDHHAKFQLLDGDLAGARATPTQVVEGGEAERDVRLKTFLSAHRALLAALTGEHTEAAQTISELPPNAGLEPEVEHRLVAGWVAVVRGNRTTARQAVAAAAERIAATECRLYQPAVAQLAAAIDNAPPPETIPRLLWIHSASTGEGVWSKVL